MGLLIEEKTALLEDRETPYTVVGYKYAENDVVFLTTEASATRSTRLERNEINALKAWIAADDYEGSFVDTADGIYVHRARSLPGRLHVRDKATGNYMFTYVPERFFRVL